MKCLSLMAMPILEVEGGHFDHHRNTDSFSLEYVTELKDGMTATLCCIC